MSSKELIEPPHEIICYALKVGYWFKERNITHWKLADCASRDAIELADKRIAELEKEAQFNFEQYQDAGRLLCEANEKLSVAREALIQLANAADNQGAFTGMSWHQAKAVCTAALAQTAATEQK